MRPHPPSDPKRAINRRTLLRTAGGGSGLHAGRLPGRGSRPVRRAGIRGDASGAGGEAAGWPPPTPLPVSMSVRT